MRGKFHESTHYDSALAEALPQILEALKEIEQRFEALEASAMEWAVFITEPGLPSGHFLPLARSGR
jgi:hypothetical protein